MQSQTEGLKAAVGKPFDAAPGAGPDGSNTDIMGYVKSNKNKQL